LIIINDLPTVNHDFGLNQQNPSHFITEAEPACYPIDYINPAR